MPNLSSSSVRLNCRSSGLTLSSRIAKPHSRSAKYESNALLEMQAAEPYSVHIRGSGNFNTCLIRAHPTTALTGRDE